MHRIGQVAECLRHGCKSAVKAFGIYPNYKASTLNHPQVKILGETVERPISLSGTLALPFNADAELTELTRTLLSMCPFRSPDAEWPAAITLTFV